jgi:DNA-binding Lrp family transcriptional regulator
MNLYIVPETYVKSAFKPILQENLKRRQVDLVFDLMADGRWRTLSEISKRLKQPIQSVSARLRDLRKDEYGGYEVLRERSDKNRTYLYKLVVED